MKREDVLSKMLFLMVDIELSDNDKRERWEESAIMLEKEIEGLPDIERLVIVNAYGLSNDERKTIDILAKEYNMTEEEIFALLSNVIKKISSYSQKSLAKRPI